MDYTWLEAIYLGLLGLAGIAIGVISPFRGICASSTGSGCAAGARIAPRAAGCLSRSAPSCTVDRHAPYLSSRT
jgi:hypothetical protein